MLTRKQQELLIFIHERLQDGGVSPSFDEMKDALSLKSKSGIHRLITALEERGFVRRLPHRARALEILKMPEGLAAPAARPASRPFRPRLIEGGRESQPAVEGALREVPVLGKIAAGTPIEALRQSDASTQVPSSMLGAGEHYALTVEGDSMIEAGIFDGDTVVIHRCDSADNGAIVVALIDDLEVTLKRLRRQGRSVALEAANPLYETRTFGPDRVQVQGRLVGLLRRY